MFGLNRDLGQRPDFVLVVRSMMNFLRNRFNSTSGILWLVVMLILPAAQVSALPEGPVPGKYSGKIESSGFISFQIDRSGKRVRNIRWALTTRDDGGDGSVSALYTITFRTRKASFPIYRGSRILVDGKADPTSKSWCTLSAGSRKRGRYAGTVQYFQDIPIDYFDVNTGNYTGTSDSRGLKRPYRFRAQVRGRR